MLSNTWYENENLEELAIKQVLEYKTFYDEKQRKPSLILQTKGKKENATDEQKHEYKLACWFSNIKSIKQGKGCQTLYPSVEKILIELFGERWYENKNMEEIAFKKALEYKLFYEKNQIKPSHVLNGKTKGKKENATEEQKHEHKLAQWFSSMKRSKTKPNKNLMKLYPSVEKIIIDIFGSDWFR